MQKDLNEILLNGFSFDAYIIPKILHVRRQRPCHIVLALQRPAVVADDVGAGVDRRVVGHLLSGVPLQ